MFQFDPFWIPQPLFLTLLLSQRSFTGFHHVSPSSGSLLSQMSVERTKTQPEKNPTQKWAETFRTAFFSSTVLFSLYFCAPPLLMMPCPLSTSHYGVQNWTKACSPTFKLVQHCGTVLYPAHFISAHQRGFQRQTKWTSCDVVVVFMMAVGAHIHEQRNIQVALLKVPCSTRLDRGAATLSWPQVGQLASLRRGSVG